MFCQLTKEKQKLNFSDLEAREKRPIYGKDQEGTNKNKGGKANTTYQKVAVTRKKLDASKIENEREKGLIAIFKTYKNFKKNILSTQRNFLNFIHLQ